MHFEFQSTDKHFTETRFNGMNKVLAMGTLFILFSGCNRSEEQKIPPYVQNLENLIVLSSVEGPGNAIHFIREMEFGSSDEQMIGKLGSFSVDKANNVYLGDIQQHSIYIFDQYGHYTASLGRQGRGPGEFNFVGYLKNIDDHLFAYDPPQFRLNVFSSKNYELAASVNLHATNKRDFEELREFDLGFLHPINKTRFLGLFSPPVIYADPSHPKYNLNDLSNSIYLLDNKGAIISDKILEYPDLRALTATVNGEYRHTQFEFLGRTLISVSNSSEIYVTRTEDFLIQVFNSEGQYERAYFYPLPKREFTREQAIKEQKKVYENDYVLEYRLSVINNAPEEQIPQFWPAIKDILIDDENRLWISTIVEDFDVYEWWVIENTGELITKFEWPRNEPIEVVKNGYIYTRETDEETGLQQVVRYKIEFDEVN